MNQALERLAREVRLNDPSNERMRLRFGYACACRVTHLLEDPEVATCLAALGDFLGGSMDRARFDLAAHEAARLANRHQGSKSIVRAYNASCGGLTTAGYGPGPTPCGPGARGAARTSRRRRMS
jgi:hypothetical protein